MIGLIVARSKNNVIGKNGNIPWKIKGEQKQFRELTTGNVVIMGRKSYEEIGHPLPNRMNIVVSTTTEYQGDNLVSVKSLEDALLLAKGRDVYISGGYGLFKEALQIVKERIEGGANEKAVWRLFINCPFVCINFDFFWLNKARQLYMDF